MQAQREYMNQTVNGTETNCFMHFPTADPTNQAIVTPNTDVTYSTVWIDLSQGDVIVRWTEKMKNLFYIVQILDFYQNVLYAPGSSRETSTSNITLKYSENHEILCARTDMLCVQSPTSLVWVVLRLQYYGEGDTESTAIRERFIVNGTENCTNSKQPEHWKYDETLHYSSDDYVGWGTMPWENITQVWNAYPLPIDRKLYEKKNYTLKAVISKSIDDSAATIGVSNNSFNPDILSANLLVIASDINSLWKDFFFNLPTLSKGYVSSQALDLCKNFNNTELGIFIRYVVAIGYIAENCVCDAVYLGAYDGNRSQTLNCRDGTKWQATLPLDMGVQRISGGYWSITMYDANTFSLVGNRWNKNKRYSYNRSNSVPGATRYKYILSKGPPLLKPDENWLLAPQKHNFYILVRTYGPVHNIMLQNITKYNDINRYD